MRLLTLFLCLQCLDVVTTLAFLANGVQEANPLVRFLFGHSASPLLVLVLVKVFAIALASYCWRNKRFQILARVNVFFAMVVLWNTVAVIVSV